MKNKCGILHLKSHISHIDKKKICYDFFDLRKCVLDSVFKIGLPTKKLKKMSYFKLGIETYFKYVQII